mmetsp:Transcript_23799/g.40710  ORF Transcript_23799/g.40710 Transcript_23799/m.40710 type:complete len:222 (+) Transcript_23799:262-927(+)
MGHHANTRTAKHAPFHNDHRSPSSCPGIFRFSRRSLTSGALLTRDVAHDISDTTCHFCFAVPCQGRSASERRACKAASPSCWPTRWVPSRLGTVPLLYFLVAQASFGPFSERFLDARPSLDAMRQSVGPALHVQVLRMFGRPMKSRCVFEVCHGRPSRVRVTSAWVRQQPRDHGRLYGYCLVCDLPAQDHEMLSDYLARQPPVQDLVKLGDRCAAVAPLAP